MHGQPKRRHEKRTLAKRVEASLVSFKRLLVSFGRIASSLFVIWQINCASVKSNQQFLGGCQTFKWGHSSSFSYHHPWIIIITLDNFFSMLLQRDEEQGLRSLLEVLLLVRILFRFPKFRSTLMNTTLLYHRVVAVLQQLLMLFLVSFLFPLLILKTW